MLLARLDAYLAGELPASELRAAADHLRACPSCRRVVEVARTSQQVLRAETAPDLVASVLARTTGSACPRAEALLVREPREAEADPGGTTLLRGHLAHCRPCRELARTVAWLLPLLPTLAELEPAPAATAHWLERTRPLLRRRARRRRLAAASAKVRHGWVEWWRRWWRRPRFAFEAAYVGTLLLVALVGTPLSPFQQVPERALTIVRAGPVDLATIGGWASGAGASALGWGARIGAGVGGLVDGVERDVGRRGAAAAPEWRRLGHCVAEASDYARAGRWPAALDKTSEAAAAAKRAWHLWWHPGGTAAANDGGVVQDAAQRRDDP
jgi:hypothetical protein